MVVRRTEQQTRMMVIGIIALAAEKGVPLDAKDAGKFSKMDHNNLSEIGKSVQRGDGIPQAPREAKANFG